MAVLGLDPGTRKCGYAILTVFGTHLTRVCVCWPPAPGHGKESSD